MLNFHVTMPINISGHLGFLDATLDLMDDRVIVLFITSCWIRLNFVQQECRPVDMLPTSRILRHISTKATMDWKRLTKLVRMDRWSLRCLRLSYLWQMEMYDVAKHDGAEVWLQKKTEINGTIAT
ncbi:hypothetical protein FPOAC2_01252 [Fusarium poae]|jgi:hypothetical protein